MKTINVQDDQSIEALAKAGLPAELVAFLTALGAIGIKPVSITASELNTPDNCDCPPGICLGEGSVSGPINYAGNEAFFQALDQADVALAGSGPEDEEDDEDEFDIEFDPDYELADEPVLTEYDRVEAIAQLGRIVETMTAVSAIHANLLQKLVA